MRHRPLALLLLAALLSSLVALPAGAAASSADDLRSAQQVRGLTADISAAEGASISWRPPRLGGEVEGYRVRLQAAIPRHAYSPVGAQARVVGGDDISIDRAPWQVMLGQVNRRHPVVPARSSCGGTLIHPRWVLTAAHCVDPDRFGRLRVASGVDDLDDLGEEDLVRVRRIVVPQTGDEGLPPVPPEAYQDIALLELVAPAPGGVPIAIDRSTSTRAGQEAFVSGWGSTRTFDPDAPTPLRPARQLQGAHIAVANDPGEPCGRVLEVVPDVGYDERIHVCAAVDGRIAACRGDSGGPLVVRRGDRWVLGGFTSWSWGCGLPGFPTVYGRVGAYHDWIVSHVPDLGWRVRNVGPDTTEVTMGGVTAGVRYRVTVEPRFADGFGPRATIAVRATAR